MSIFLQRRARSSGSISPRVFFFAAVGLVRAGVGVDGVEGVAMGGTEVGVAAGVDDWDGGVSCEPEAGAGDAGFESLDGSHPIMAKQAPTTTTVANNLGRRLVRPLGSFM